MKRKTIAGTELVSSSLALGGVPIGSKLNENDSFKLMDDYVELGGNMVDTAEVYNNWLPLEANISEKIIGRWMKARNNRSQLIVATKGAHPHLSTMHIPRMSPEEITYDLEGSLQRLQVETIDLYWLHRDDPGRSVGEILETLNRHVREGKIRYFGCSNWTVARIQEAQAYAAAQGLQGFSGNQMSWSLAAVDPAKISDPTTVAMSDDMQRYHVESGLTAIPYSSQAQGLFTKLGSGKYSFDGDQVKPAYRSELNRGRLDRIRQLAAESSLTISQIVLGYLMSQPFPTIPIIGCYSREQLDDCLLADRVQLTQEQLRYLEKGS
ncbi:aldo/keto reductase [Paenibacillus thalictri]|uniref:Aldo/keto reductase n=1 Tax=Paenibacillus thalictri TaxID=2527873 RepID=A0A4Q9E1R7_9BACL|nr:aldo/keto reductase [Paenibacillus thalictri]TBL81531.1 aldo/keto reductase [Paenibacillus thalictri]